MTLAILASAALSFSIYLTEQCASISDAALRVYCAQGIERGLIFNAKPGSEIPRSAAFCLYNGHTKAKNKAVQKRWCRAWWIFMEKVSAQHHVLQ